MELVHLEDVHLSFFKIYLAVNKQKQIKCEAFLI